jgi:hypothetical protein
MNLTHFKVFSEFVVIADLANGWDRLVLKKEQSRRVPISLPENRNRCSFRNVMSTSPVAPSPEPFGTYLEEYLGWF